MAFPYQCVSSLGKDGLLCAARSSSIFVFGIDGAVLSSWQHPAAHGKADESNRVAGNGTPELELFRDKTEESSPASKRRKVDVDSEAGVHATPREPIDDTSKPAEGEPNIDGKKDTRKGRAKISNSNVQDHPIVYILKTSSNSNHVVAVTGQDKTIWVFEHDGRGQLKELSHRSMPKRPSDLALTLDNKTLLVADKFGDVYSIPLIPSTTSPLDTGNDAPSTVEARQSTQRLVSKGANILTVHSQRNVKALEDQRRQRESGQEHERKEAPSFEHELLLGHVSMLTSVAAASSDGKPYILTADRDEHIRVSRGIPQAHVIENYCLGHTSFINALCLVQPDILVSGGGDSELYVWDWQAGTQKAKVDLLRHVQGVVPDTDKIAVSKLYSCSGEVLVAICERIPAVFAFKLSDGIPVFSQTLQLHGYPLDLAFLRVETKAPRLVVAIDAYDTKDSTDGILESFLLNEGSWVPASDILFQQADGSGPEATRAELDKLLYGVEYLRKTGREDRAENTETAGSGSEAVPVAP